MPARTSLQLTGFYIKAEDFIEKDSSDVYQNFQELQFQGIETALTTHVVDNAMLRIAYTLLDTEDKSDNATRDQLQYRPTHTVTIEGSYTFGFGLNIYASMKHVADQYFYDDSETLKTAGPTSPSGWRPAGAAQRTITALLAGIMALILGMGKGGPLILIRYLLPAMVVDAMAVVLADSLFQSMLLCMLTAVLAASTRFPSDAAMDLLAGMEFSVMIRHAALQTASNMVFGGIGALGVPAVLRKLRAFGAIEPS